MARSAALTARDDVPFARWTTDAALGADAPSGFARVADAAGRVAGLRARERSGHVNAVGKAVGLGQVGGRLLDRLSRLPHGVEPRARAQALAAQRAACDLATLHNLDVEVRGQQPARPCILVSNHLSYLDPVVLSTVTPSLCVAKAGLAYWPWFGRLMKALGVIFVERGDPHSGAAALRRMARVLETGTSVLTFPEGMTSWGDDVRSFKRGAFGLALRLDVPVVPVRISYRDRDLAWVGDESFVPHYLRMVSRERIDAMVAFGPPLDVGEARSPEALAERAREAVLSLSYV